MSVQRADKFVLIDHESKRNTEQVVDVAKSKDQKPADKAATSARESFERIGLKAYEAPLPSFDKALQALGSAVGVIMGAGSDWGQTGVEITALHVSYTEHGIRSAQIVFTKSLLKGSSTHPLKTPFFQIDDGKSNDQGKRQCAPSHAEAIIEFIKEAQRYVLGERSQEMLNFKEPEAAGSIEQLPGMAGAPTVDEE